MQLSNCDICDKRPGVRTVIAYGIETWACAECLGDGDEQGADYDNSVRDLGGWFYRNLDRLRARYVAQGKQMPSAADGLLLGTARAQAFVNFAIAQFDAEMHAECDAPARAGAGLERAISRAEGRSDE